MEVRFSCNRWDLFVATLVATYRRPSIMMLALPVGIFVAHGEAEEGFRRFEPAFVVTVLVVLALAVSVSIWAFSLFVAALIAALRPGPLPGLLGEHLIRVSDDGLYEETSVNATHMAWAGVTAVRKSWYGVLILVAGNGFLVPKRFFSGRAHVESFVAELRSHMVSARP